MLIGFWRSSILMRAAIDAVKERAMLRRIASGAAQIAPRIAGVEIGLDGVHNIGEMSNRRVRKVRL
jgi:hypothetical protein